MDRLQGLQNLSTQTISLASAGILGALSLASTMGLFGRKNQMPVDGRTVLLTGASDGMGRSAVRLLSEQGANLILVARNIPRLEEAVAEAKAAAKSPQTQRFHYITADVSQPGYAVRVVHEATAWNGGRAPDVVWCAAGSSTPMLWADSEEAVAVCRRLMDLNFFGAAEMSHAILRAWYEYDDDSGKPGESGDVPALSAPRDPRAAKPEPRHLIFTLSSLAFYSVAGYGTYTPSKSALRGLADTICQETLLYADHPVRVHLVAPGTILSPGFEREQQTKPDITLHLEKDDPRQTPDEVASLAIRGLQRGQYMATTNLFGSLMRLVSLNGSLRDNLLVDTVGAWIINLAFVFVLFFMRGDISAYGKKHGHPRTYPKKKIEQA